MEYTTQQQPVVPPMRPKNWLVESILVTILCCLPFGIAGIVFASQVNSKYDTGDFDGALKASKEAGNGPKLVSSLALQELYVIFFLFCSGEEWPSGRQDRIIK